jgi:hypothetical protein
LPVIPAYAGIQIRQSLKHAKAIVLENAPASAVPAATRLELVDKSCRSEAEIPPSGLQGASIAQKGKKFYELLKKLIVPRHEGVKLNGRKSWQDVSSSRPGPAGKDK